MRAPPTTRICIDLPATAQSMADTVPAAIVRVQRCGDGWYDVGALFLKTPSSDAPRLETI